MADEVAELDFPIGVDTEDRNGLIFRVEDDGTFTCVNDGKGGYPSIASVRTYWNLHSKENPKYAETAVKRGNAASSTHPDGSPVIRSKRGSERRLGSKDPTPLEEIRPRPGGMRGGPAAYFIRPDGASVREALIIYPNGAPVFDSQGRDRANSESVQARQARRGRTYIGPQLTFDGVRKLVEVVNGNKEDYILDLREQIADAEYTNKTSDDPQLKQQARRRVEQLSRNLRVALRDIDPDAIVSELEDILKAQKLAALTPSMREAITMIAGEEISEKMQKLIAKMEGKTVRTSGETALDSIAVEVTNAEPADVF